MARQKLTHAYYAFIRREGHLYKVFLVLAKPRLILDEMCHLYRKFVSYLRCVLCNTHLTFPRKNGPNILGGFAPFWPDSVRKQLGYM